MPRTRWGLFVRNQIVRAFGVPIVSRLAMGHEITDHLQLPDYSLASDES